MESENIFPMLYRHEMEFENESPKNKPKYVSSWIKLPLSQVVIWFRKRCEIKWKVNAACNITYYH